MFSFSFFLFFIWRSWISCRVDAAKKSHTVRERDTLKHTRTFCVTFVSHLRNPKINRIFYAFSFYFRLSTHHFGKYFHKNNQTEIVFWNIQNSASINCHKKFMIYFFFSPPSAFHRFLFFCFSVVLLYFQSHSNCNWCFLY